MYSLIHSVDDFQIFPGRLVIQEGIPARIHNISLVAEHRVSFKPFDDPPDINVRPREVNMIDFTPNEAGQFTIIHELHGFTGELVVEGNSIADAKATPMPLADAIATAQAGREQIPRP